MASLAYQSLNINRTIMISYTLISNNNLSSKGKGCFWSKYLFYQASIYSRNTPFFTQGICDLFKTFIAFDCAISSSQTMDIEGLFIESWSTVTGYQMRCCASCQKMTSRRRVNFQPAGSISRLNIQWQWIMTRWITLFSHCAHNTLFIES